MTDGRVFILGVGHRARQGKDTIAQYILTHRAQVYVMHFADALYEEVRNKDRRYPLVTKLWGLYGYGLLDNAEDGRYIFKSNEEVPYLHKIMSERNIDGYWGMDEKDAPMLQFWGTDFRRTQHPDYWVRRANEQVQFLIRSREKALDLWIVLSDTRFKNEVAYVKSQNGYYIRVERFEKPGVQFIDSSRDPNHPSEIDIQNEQPYEIIAAVSGDLDRLHDKTEKLLNRLERQ